MVTSVIDLASPVFMFLATFQRKLAKGVTVLYEDARREALALLRDGDERALGEMGLAEKWAAAKNAVVYLIDEVMIVNSKWANSRQWEEANLEQSVLSHPKSLAGVLFFEEADEALKKYDSAERMRREDAAALADLIAVFYMCMRLGFKGRMAADAAEWADYSMRLFSRLPANARTRTKELMPEAYQSTIRREPVYEPVMKLITVVIIFAGLLLTYLVLTHVAWNGNTQILSDVANALR